MQKITPFLWFDNQAEEAANFYVSIFKNSRVIGFSRSGEDGPGPKGSVMTAEFELDGQRFVALNGGPVYPLTPAVSFVVNCDSQEEADEFWTKLSEGGKEVQCCWLTDKYGLSWQIVPKIIMEMLKDKDPAKSNRVMQAILQMVKPDIAAAKRAYESA